MNACLSVETRSVFFTCAIYTRKSCNFAPAKKNSIMLVEFATHIKHEKNVSYSEALLQACPVRLRPILMTSVATVMAALPLVLGGGLGQETRKPMGLVIIGGMIVSTTFTLFVVPIFYLVLNNLGRSKNKS